MARRSPRAPTEPFAAAPHALGERRAASRGRYPPAALLRHARHACAVAGQRESGGSGCEYGDETAALRDKRSLKVRRVAAASLTCARAAGATSVVRSGLRPLRAGRAPAESHHPRRSLAIARCRILRGLM